MSDTPQFNTNLKFVRIIETHANGLVEFEFAVGEPELFVELLMAQAPFDEFCATHGVIPSKGRLQPAPRSTLFPYTTLFRSTRAALASRQQSLKPEQ